MSTAESIKLKIDEKAYSYAKIYAALLNEEYQRKRSYASITALYAFLNLLEQTPYNLQKSMTLFRNPLINEKYEVTDVYINNWHLDIRVLTGGDAVLVPKIHYDNDILPDYYVVIKVDSELKNAELLGIADTKDQKQEPFDYNYCSIPLNTLINYEEFLRRIKNPKAEIFTEKDHEFFRESYLGFMDNNINAETENRLIKHLFNCSDCRTEFCCFTGFEMVSCNSSKYNDLFNDKTLGIIGAQDVDDKKYEGKEEIINIADDSEEEVSDILDELFEDTQEFIGEDEQKSDVSEITEIKEQDENIELADSSENEDILVPETEDITDIIEPDELKNFEDNPTEIIEDDEIKDFAESQDLEVITDDEKDLFEENNADLSDKTIPESDDLEVFNDEDDIKIIEEENEVIRPMGAYDYNETEETPESTESVLEQPNTTEQRVIVDYDETGEPIYSYITSIEQEDSEEFPDSDNEFMENSQTENISDTDIIDNTASAEGSLEPETGDSDTEFDYNDEHYVEANDTNDETEFDSEQEFSNEYSENVNETENQSENETEDETDNESSDTEDEEFEEYNDENDDDSEHNDEEYEEYDEDGEIEPVENSGNNSATRLVVLAISVIVILGLIGGGAFFFLKNSKNNGNQTANNIKTQEVAENAQADFISNQPGDTAGFDMNTQNPPQTGDNAGFDMNTANQPNTPNDAQDFFDVPNEAPNNVPNPEQNGNNTQDNIVPPLTENDLINQNPAPEQNNTNNNINANGDVNKAMVNSFAPSNQGVSLNGLNWFCSTELFTNNAFKNYMQNLDNILKQNLKNNLMSATEVPPQNSVTAKFAIDNNGNLIKVIVSSSSGSAQIDELVLRSINETFEGEKSQILNDSPLKSDKYYLKVVIKL